MIKMTIRFAAVAGIVWGGFMLNRSIEDQNDVFESVWRDRVKDLALVAADTEQKLIIVESQDPKPVKTEVIKSTTQDIVEVEIEKPEVFPRHHVPVSDICTRHHMHKVFTHGGKSWRCKK